MKALVQREDSLIKPHQSQNRISGFSTDSVRLARFNQRILPLNQSLHNVSIYYLMKALESRVMEVRNWTNLCMLPKSLDGLLSFCSSTFLYPYCFILCLYHFLASLYPEMVIPYPQFYGEILQCHLIENILQFN